ncbi:hypothetical protein [Kushneria avicenniae]|uniref:hypothetical protein n=1 Tax=Kushneria avicenniae TaxID=402385 RepID=UPI001FE04D63|nr:hypothetical protein [Kushneria avicenniae]
MNQATYNRLSPALQKVIDDNSGLQEAQRIGRVMDEAEAEVIETVASRDDAEMIYIAQKDQKPWQAAADKTVQQWIGDMKTRGMDGQQLYDDAMGLVGKYTRQTQ